MCKCWCIEGSSDSSHVSHPHLAITTLQGGPVFVHVYVCVRVCTCVCLWQGWVGKCVWWPSSSLEDGSSSSPPPSDLTQSCFTPCCYSKPENQLWRHYVCKMRLWKQFESYFIARITSVASQNNMCMCAVHKMPMVHTTWVCFQPGNSALQWLYVIQPASCLSSMISLTNMTIISKNYSYGSKVKMENTLIKSKSNPCSRSMSSKS